jgi:hypothetical protein
VENLTPHSEANNCWLKLATQEQKPTVICLAEMPCYVVINATLTIRILYLMSGTDGNSTLPIEPSIAFLDAVTHLVVKGSFLSLNGCNL